MIKVSVTDIVTTDREIELPDACPECDASLRRDGGLHVVEWQDQTRHATAGQAGDSVDFEWPDLPEGGECTMVTRWACAACNHVLAEGREASHDEDVTESLFEPDPPPGGRRPVEDGRHDPEL